MATTFQIIGFKKSGKTAITEALTADLSTMGLSVGVIKHDAHKAAMDVTGTDTDRFAKAGANHVILQSDTGIFYHETNPDAITVSDLVKRLPDSVDIVLVEGFKPAPYNKLALLRSNDHLTDFANVPNIVNFASLNPHSEASLIGQPTILNWLKDYLLEGNDP